MPVGSTNFRQPLSSLAASRDSDALLLLSDGRQTSGADALPIVQAIHAHGRRLGALVIGDPEQPRDAVIADLRVPEEVFAGERIPVQVRFRISGFSDQPWNLIIERDGIEVDRRSVRPAPEWQNERFEVAAQSAENIAATHRFVAKLEPEVQAQPTGEARGLLREVWTGVDGTEIKSLLQHAAYPDSPSKLRLFQRLARRKTGLTIMANASVVILSHPSPAATFFKSVPMIRRRYGSVAVTTPHPCH